MGGIISANMAALATSSGLPAPKAVMAVEPGLTEQPIEKAKVSLEDLSQVPASVLLLTLAGDQDKLAGETDAKKIFNQSTRIAQKNYIIVQSDDHGNPPLIANHSAPISPLASYTSSSQNQKSTDNESNESTNLGSRLRDTLKDRIRNRIKKRIKEKIEESADLSNAQGGADALDYYGYWKLFDGLTDCAFRRTNCNYALSGTAEQRYMGKWSDGVPVKELKAYTKIE